jgi:hypothetical protein
VKQNSPLRVQDEDESSVGTGINQPIVILDPEAPSIALVGTNAKSRSFSKRLEHALASTMFQSSQAT